MIRLTKLADYAVVIMTHMAHRPQDVHSASGLAAATQIPTPTVSKILGAATRAGLLTSHRGLNGGFALGRGPRTISVADIVSAVDGPIALTECVEHGQGDCDILTSCQVRGTWQKINDAIQGALESVTLADLTAPRPDFLGEALRDERRAAEGKHLQSMGHAS